MPSSSTSTSSSFTGERTPSRRALRVAVVGSGLAGLATAHLLSSLVENNGQSEEDGVDVQLFEKDHKLALESSSSNPRPCGHGPESHCEAGTSEAMQSFYSEYSPNLIRLYRSLGIHIQPIDNTLACSNIRPSNASTKDALLSSLQAVDSPYLSSRSYRAAKDYNVSLPDMAPFSIWNPFYFVRRLRRYTRIARDYTRILVVSKEFLAKGQITDVGKHPIEWRNGRLVTLREFLEAGGYSIEFCEFFVPLVASTCFCSFDRIMEYPACVVLEYVARCMPFGRKQSVLVGEQRVAAKLAENIGTIHYNTTIESIAETNISTSEDGPVTLIDSYGVPRTFDHVIFATQADQAASILARFKPKSVPAVHVSSSSDNEKSDSSGSSQSATGAQLLEETPTSHPFYQQIKMLLRFPYERVQVVCHSDLSFLPKNRTHWRQLNIAKAKDADVMACPLERWSKELDQELELNSRKTYRRRTSIFSLRPSRILSRKNSSISKHQERPFFSSTPIDPLGTRPNSGSPSTSGLVMTTQVVNRNKSVGDPILQTTNPLFPPRPELVISSTWLERAVVNVESAKALDHLHRQMDRQQDSNASKGSLPRVWFVGSYASPGIPSLESCVSSAVNVMDRIVDAESHRQLVGLSETATHELLEHRSLLREQQAISRSRGGSGGATGLERQTLSGRSHRGTRSANLMHFQTAWRDEVENEARARHGRVSWSSVDNIMYTFWIAVLYLGAFAQWWVVVILESLGLDSKRWATL
ncbi:hypothetical protein BGZ59_009008 [Podila verticillata]|nr:hypothetical protein BGZ59_009008 [Podila verticillata]KAI9238549.1 MAG: hypothetical protein BYD32DRAFT_413485 [Podila humilis]KFH68142.1 hypothetical protein MVEG_06871 [Podila verticillata NRRL 6337]